jgi:hypothetical protein
MHCKRSSYANLNQATNVRRIQISQNSYENPFKSLKFRIEVFFMLAGKISAIAISIQVNH